MYVPYYLCAKINPLNFAVQINRTINKMELTQKKVIIIGGTSGIGKATAEMAAKLSNQVILTGRSLTEAQKVAKELGNNTIGWALDVNEEGQVNAFFSELSGIDHIYIAAGNTKLGAVTDGTLEGNLGAFDTRLRGGLRVVRAAVNKMNPGGSFVFTGGISTDRPIAGAWVSGLGTASAEQLARVLVLEFTHLRFNAIAPGYTDTPMWDAIMGDQKAAILAEVAAKIPVKKIASPQEVASAVIFLMSNASVNGEIIHIDGGSRLVTI